MSKACITGLAHRLREFARVVGVPVRKIAVAAGVNYTQLSKYSDAQLPGGAVLFKLEQRVGLSASWWLTGNGTMYARNDAGRKLVDQYMSRVVIAKLDHPMAESLEKAGLTVVPSEEQAEALWRYIAGGLAPGERCPRPSVKVLP